ALVPANSTIIVIYDITIVIYSLVPYHLYLCFKRHLNLSSHTITICSCVVTFHFRFCFRFFVFFCYLVHLFKRLFISIFLHVLSMFVLAPSRSGCDSEFLRPRYFLFLHPWKRFMMGSSDSRSLLPKRES